MKCHSSMLHQYPASIHTAPLAQQTGAWLDRQNQQAVASMQLNMARANRHSHSLSMSDAGRLLSTATSALKDDTLKYRTAKISKAVTACSSCCAEKASM